MSAHGEAGIFALPWQPQRPAGRFSVTATDQAQPEFIAKTRCVYIVESIDEAHRWLWGQPDS